MKKIYLSVVGFSIICSLSLRAQTRPDTLPKLPPVSLYKPVEQKALTIPGNYKSKK